MRQEAGLELCLLPSPQVFSQSDALRESRDVQVELAYFEIYNETIRDLLSEEPRPLELREGEKGAKVTGLTWWHPEDAAEVLKLISIGSSRRVKGETNANEASSRSHAVLQIVVQSKSKTEEVNTTWQIGKLSLIDLAGSERAAATENRGLRMKEGANINKSLLALGNVINALASRRPRSFVGYRDSKLTRVLKDSLGGNCRTLMITNISPSSLTYEDSHNALKYASRAKSIAVDLKKNTATVSAHISRYKAIIDQLTKQVEDLQQQLQDANRGKDTDPSRADGMRSAEAHPLHRVVLEMMEREFTVRSKISFHERGRHQTLVKYRQAAAEALQWREKNTDGGQEPVGMVTKEAEMQKLQLLARSHEKQILHYKEELCRLAEGKTKVTEQIPLLPDAVQRDLENIIHMHAFRFEGIEGTRCAAFSQAVADEQRQKYCELEHAYELMHAASEALQMGDKERFQVLTGMSRRWWLASKQGTHAVVESENETSAGNM
eukprot:Sspe_Gene.1713::Locus_570_Transcript_2_3_Confidence_0.333_Length_2050::g.1713::m.1713/K10401/KIF18_19; kinesin family member 18/19